ncbi:glutamate--tRNA ligase [Parvularcula lutaonensis]|uniref:Glutamate--tRNA ligase n=1 Tax=Parvularcula lutaonensis TaxID=491923 RepID=A0ABV7MFK8_9PROT|nr:glutamate--tRNA ligase [Parvularcula lutaonensis]GGY52371.1 glutamate--tRNA ligase 1 [Parvularcula lutaonensis]
MTADTKPIVTRFAPSPTGYLHIGGARTALFNWLYARRNAAADGSKFLLRIEDTDRARHNEAAVEAILDGLTWLGLDWDGEPLSQFERADRHKQVAHELLKRGKAFKCWLAGEELDKAREEAREKNIRFTSPYRDGGEGEGPYSIRLKAPIEGETIVKDEVQGEVRFPNATSDDVVLLRSDGTPTYMLAVVVDDHDMGVTHVIRGDDHLNNTPKQQQIYEAMGWDVPVFAHIPLIHGNDGKKLSKRHGALGVEAYRDQGFVPEGLMNALLKLGWSHGDDEIITREQALAWFDLGGIGKAPARLDPDKMANTNAHYIEGIADEDFADAIAPFLEKPPSEAQREMITRAAPFLKPRMKLLSEARNAAAFLLLERPFEITGKAAKPLKKDGALGHLAALAQKLETVESWDPATLDLAVQTYAEENGVGFGQVGPPLRAALTAGNPAPTLGETLFALGRDEALARITAAQDSFSA